MRWFYFILFLLGFHCSFAGIDAPRFIIKPKNQNVFLNQSFSGFTKPVPIAGGAYLIEPKQISSILMNEQTINQYIRKLSSMDNIEWVVPDRKGQFNPPPKLDITSFSNLLSHESQWDEFIPPAGIALESAPYKLDGAWAYSFGKSTRPIVIAVLDTGIELHPDLNHSLLHDGNGNIIGWNFAKNNNNIHDETKSWHGTHVSGTIAGYGQVMQGMGHELKILTVKIPDGSGMFYESAVINAIYWAAGADVPGVPHNPYPAKVINMSFGVDEAPNHEIDHCDKALQEAVKFARSKGVLLVAAAGNDNKWDHYNAPAVCNHVLKIASTGPEGLRSYFSNYGSAITLAAPGGDKKYGIQGGILSTVHPDEGYLNSGYDFYQGTSMASPHVSGVAGLIYAIKSGRVKPQTVEQILFATTHDFGQSKDSNKSCRGKKPCGHGILDALQAVVAAVQGYDVFYMQSSVKNSKDAFEVVANNRKMKNNQGFWYKNNDIFVSIGNKQLRLKKELFLRCDIIGFDGLGCVSKN